MLLEVQIQIWTFIFSQITTPPRRGFYNYNPTTLVRYVFSTPASAIGHNFRPRHELREPSHLGVCPALPGAGIACVVFFSWMRAVKRALSTDFFPIRVRSLDFFDIILNICNSSWIINLRQVGILWFKMKRL